ncbi:sensor histidine kinase [Streptosporangium sp. NPDC001559]|uniref:sensor histidine kinase n=1 Tax=Streptosporangium sp. NPDC001559 TaxID=3366187 RepID=UPI0036EC9A4A
MRRSCSLGWRDSEYLAARPGRDRVNRFVVMLLVLQRASYLVPAVAGAFSADRLYRSAALNAVLLTVAVAWNAALVVTTRRRGWFARWTVAADVAVTCGLLLAVGANCLGDFRAPANWSSSALMATGALTGAVAESLAWAWALLPPALAYLVAHAGDLGSRYPLPIDIAVRLNSYLWFAAIVCFIHRYLRAQANRLDDLADRRLAAETGHVADQARSAERLAHYRRLHDTVLTTLTAIARGGLDHREEQVRLRCAADAEYVRLLIGREGTGTAARLEDGLAKVITRASGLGLRVRYAAAALPERVPAAVVSALADASQEALNNVALHSATKEAWLTVVGEDAHGNGPGNVPDDGRGHRVTVRVVDRGRGFDPASTTPGFGLASSVAGRMREVGGQATVLSAEGEGTCVELVWPGDPAGSGTGRSSTVTSTGTEAGPGGAGRQGDRGVHG